MLSVGIIFTIWLTLLKIQGHIWRTGFQNNELKGMVFDDVPEALEKWQALGIKVSYTLPLLLVFLLDASSTCFMLSSISFWCDYVL